MAALSSISCLFRLFILICFTSLVIVVQPHGAFLNPSSDSLEIVSSVDGSRYEDLHKTFYHVHNKRSANNSNKKAIEIDKKVTIKNAAVKAFSKFSDSLNVDSLNVTGNITELAPTVVADPVTPGSNSPEDKYDSSISSSGAPTSSAASSSPNTTSSAFITTPSPSSVVPANGSSSTSTMTTVAPNVTKENPESTDTSEILPTKPPGVGNATEDNHLYYNSSLILEEEKAMSYRVDFDKLPQDKIVKHRMLSDSHRRAATVTLSFDFPFYGNPMRNITIATGGFLYMGDYMHSWLAATQYVAPLMANFDTRLSNESTVRFFDNGTAFVIEWNEVVLQEGQIDEKFIFQAILLKSGDIIFVYESVPVSIMHIGDESHPVKIGLSDAYVIDRVIYFIRRKTIYEYHRINLKRNEISNRTAIYFTALPTCLNFQNCETCMAANITFDCAWCEGIKRCSDGFDRKRQDWLQQNCDVQKSKVDCSHKFSPDSGPYVQPYTDTPSKTHTQNTSISSNDIMQHPSDSSPQEPNHKPGQASSYDDGISHSAQVVERHGNFGIGGVVAVLLLVALAVGTVAWVGYAYRNPHTSSGQLLIKYRPSQWRFRSGEARYTAASVHM